MAKAKDNVEEEDDTVQVTTKADEPPFAEDLRKLNPQLAAYFGTLKFNGDQVRGCA